MRFDPVRLTATLALSAVLTLAAPAAGGTAAGGTADGVAAFRRGDYPRALAEFQDTARRGDATARYYLGVMAADGLGMGRNPVLAFDLLACVAAETEARALKASAGEKLRQVTREHAAVLANRTACGVTAAQTPAVAAEDETPLIFAPREGAFGTLFWRMGERAIGAVIAAGDLIDTPWPRRLMRTLHGTFGDQFVAVAAILAWVAIAKAASTAFALTSRLLAPRIVLDARTLGLDPRRLNPLARRTAPPATRR